MDHTQAAAKPETLVVQPGGVLFVSLGSRRRFGRDDAETLKDFVDVRLGPFIKKGIFFPSVGDENPMDEDSQESILKLMREWPEQQTSVVFIITDFAAAESETVQSFVQRAKETISAKGRIRAYQIILDMLREFERYGHGCYGEKISGEHDAFRLDALPCLCNRDPFSIGYRRLVELMSRILGLDLPEPHFPDYEWRMLMRIALHINRENFNPYRPRIGAIPKYGFDTASKPVITEEMLKGFEQNIEVWEKNAPKVKETILYECPHCTRELKSYDIWDQAVGKIVCFFCKKVIDVSGTGFKL